jgi:Bacterial pre-peptidase C-terminal domain
MKNIQFGTTGSVNSTLLFGNFISPDVYTFFAQAGERIRLETSNLQAGLDTTIRVVGPDASITLFDDDGAGGLASRLVFTAADTGWYVAVVSTFSGNPGGGNYTLNFARGAAALQALDEVSEDTERGKSTPDVENQVEEKAGT